MSKRERIVPPHYLVELSGKEEAENVAERLALLMEEYDLCEFMARDKWLFYTLDGTTSQMQNIFAKIRTSAVYTQNFRGVVALEISALKEYPFDEQTKLLARTMKQIGKEAGVLLLSDGNAGELFTSLREEMPDLIKTKEWGLKRER